MKESRSLVGKDRRGKYDRARSSCELKCISMLPFSRIMVLVAHSVIYEFCMIQVLPRTF